MKICVCGSPWAGKSTISTSLSNQYGIEIFHLDELFIDYDRNKKTHKERVAIQRSIIDAHESRIIDWNYWDTMEERIKESDCLYILKIPRLICVYRVIQRYIYNRINISSRIWIWEKKLVISRSFILFVWNYHKTTWSKILEDSIINNSFGKEVHIITRKDQLTKSRI